MSFLKNPHLDLTLSRIETARCILVPFSLEVGVDMSELRDEFAKANKDLYVAPYIPTLEEEINFVRDTALLISRGQEFENFILEKTTHHLIGCALLRILTTGELNIGIWIRENMQGRGYATEIYETLLSWAREHTPYTYVKHSLNPENIASRNLAQKFGGVLQEHKTDSGHDIYYIPI